MGMSNGDQDLHPVRGDRAWARLPLALLAALVAIWLVTGFSPPAGHLDYLLEIGPALLGIAALAITFRRFPMSRIVYLGVFLHALILTYGGYYTYALAPLGEWMRTAFHLSRNHYDRIGHFALGFFPAITIREVLLRATPLRRGGWLNFLVGSVVLAIAAAYELIEWWSALMLDPKAAADFLGSQGDIWDAQWDMLFGLVGAVVSLLVLRGAHDRSMRALFEQQAGAASERDRAAVTVRAAGR